MLFLRHVCWHDCSRKKIMSFFFGPRIEFNFALCVYFYFFISFSLFFAACCNDSKPDKNSKFAFPYENARNFHFILFYFIFSSFFSSKPWSCAVSNVHRYWLSVCRIHTHLYTTHMSFHKTMVCCTYIMHTYILCKQKKGTT